MSNLENLVSKIIQDSEEKAKSILSDANEKAEEIKNNYIKRGEQEQKNVLSDAEEEAKKAKEQIILTKKLEIRNNLLSAKQQMIDKVFDVALEELNAMNKDDFFNFLTKYLLQFDLDGEEIMFPSKLHVENIDELNQYLQQNGKKGNLKLYQGSRDIDGGFILMKDGIEKNNTFEALIHFYRYDLEREIINIIF